MARHRFSHRPVVLFFTVLTALVAGNATVLAQQRPVPGPLVHSFGDTGVLETEVPTVSPEIRVDRRGRIITADDIAIRRFLPNGRVDESFARNGVARVGHLAYAWGLNDIDLSANGGLLVSLRTQNLQSDGGEGIRVIKLDGRGTPIADADAMPGFKQPPGFDYAIGPAVDERKDGSVFLAGFTSYDMFGPGPEKARARLWLYKPDGSLDRTFGRKGSFNLLNHDPGYIQFEFTDVKTTADGGAIVAGVLVDRLVLLKVDRHGELDKRFGEKNGRTFRSIRIGNAQDGRLGISVDNRLVFSPHGNRIFIMAGDGARNVFAFDEDGRAIRSFGKNGRATIPRGGSKSGKRFRASSLAAIDGGRILLAGAKDTPARRSGTLMLLDRNGDLIRSYGKNGVRVGAAPGIARITDTVFDRRGRLLAAGVRRERADHRGHLHLSLAQFGPRGS